jgi:hypothetical protein
MSVLRSRLSSRVRLPLVAASVLLISAMLAAPQVSQAKPAAVKLFTAHIAPITSDGGVPSAWNETVHNCGPSDTDAPCNRASTIALAFVRIAVPNAFQTSDFSASIQSASGHNWTAGYNSTTHLVTAQATTGSDKLQAGESAVIHFTATPKCISGDQQFSTQAWGDFSFGDQFTVAGTTNIVVATPTVTISGCDLGPGDSVTDPTGTQKETVDGDFTGTLNVVFGGNLSCSDDAQWQAGYQLPYQVTITPGPGFQAGSGPKISTSTFDPTVPGDSSIDGDSSWYRICYQDSEGTRILPLCYPGGGADLNPPPCVDQQYRDFTTHKIVIAILLPTDDPAKH